MPFGGETEVLPPLTPSLRNRVPTPLIGYRDWMTHHRGLKAPTLDRYEWIIAKLLPSLGENTAAYNAAQVRQVFLREVNQLSTAYAKTFVTAFRAFLRFLAVQG